MIKGLKNIKGAIVSGYSTFTVVYGERKTKIVSIILLFFNLILTAMLLQNPAIGNMKYYFYFAILALIFVGIYLWKSKEKKQYRILHNILKILLLVGVLSIVFIDNSLLMEVL